VTGPSIDLNADLGEEVTDDAALLRLVTSANVACGYHAGTHVTMRAVCAQAAELDVAIGAQVSYADREHFGRVALDVPAALLTEQVADQVGTLAEIAVSEGTFVSYLKPHGALYHRVRDDADQAAAVLAGAGHLPVLGQPGELLRQAAAAGLTTYLEGFADRAYRGDRLVRRDEPGALLEDLDAIAEQAVFLALGPAGVDSVCVHGDSPGAVEAARAVRRALTDAGLELAAPWWG
jgi:5-oxoprolinase (ATP-hydrolysing) subunit A